MSTVGAYFAGGPQLNWRSMAPIREVDRTERNLLSESRMRRMTQMTQIVAAELREPLRDIRVIFRVRDSDRCGTSHLNHRGHGRCG